MRSFLFLALVFALPGASFATETRVTRHIHLDRPGVLEAIGESNPSHYAKILTIMQVSQMESCEHLPKILKTREGLGVGEASCDSFTLLTSYPPKRHMTFVLDDVRYTTNVAQVRLQSARRLPVPGCNEVESAPCAPSSPPPSPSSP